MEDLVAFLEDEFWVLFFAMLYALSVVFFLLACAHKYFGSRKRVWTYVIVAFVPWTIGTTMWLIDPRWEQWTLDAVKKSYFRWQELRHRPKAMWERWRDGGGGEGRTNPRASTGCSQPRRRPEVSGR